MISFCSARILLAAVWLVPTAAFAAAAPKLAPLRPYRTETPPVIDGVLDDAVWTLAPSETGFKTWRPDMGLDMHQRTVVYYAYDRENVYFAFRCFDAEPSKIKAAVSNRDNIFNDDWICINLDSFNDQQSLYALYVNPLGIQADSRFEASVEDFSVDIVWFSAGRIDAEGYTIEIRLPFKSLRYASTDPVEMGIIFERCINRFSESGTYPPLDRAQGLNFLTQTRPLLFEGVKHYTLLELLPAVTYGRTSVAEEGALRAEPARRDLSLTAKYGLTSQLVLDGAINPDFSQVEADAGQVDFNLRYALFYPEKRAFFLEGQEKFALAGSSGDPLGAIVNTRSIVNPYLGLKLNGKLGRRDTIASIYAMDELPEGSADKFAQFTIVRYKHALSQDGFLGGFLTGRFEGSHYNAVAGTDGQVRLTPAAAVGYHAFLSRTRPGSIEGGGDVRSGHAVGASYNYQSRDWIINVYAQDLSRNFETETGYLTRNGISKLLAGFLPMIYPKSKLVLRVDPIVHFIGIKDKESGLWETTEQADLRFILPLSTSITFGGKSSTEVFLGRRFGRSSARIIAASQLSKHISLIFRLNSGQKIRYVADPYQGRGTDLTAEATFQPSEKLLFDLTGTYSDFTRSSNGLKEYDYSIVRSLNTYQVNKYLFFRAIAEYNSFYRELMTDFLASFTYIPGTVIYIGYGSLYDRMEWREDERVDVPADRFREIKRGFFFKASYLWRL
jgi:hypothetical protein